jgi:dipeptidyl aminopeptidase/acylaminoacyl peptidase
VFSLQSAGTGEDLWLLSFPDGKPVPYLEAPFGVHSGAVSPDGRWMAYVSDERGSPEVYLRSFTDSAATDPVHVASGAEPRWGTAGGEIFLRRGAEIVAVPVLADGRQVRVGPAAGVLDTGTTVAGWDVSPDGRRLIVGLERESVPPAIISLVVHWNSLLADAR